MADEFGYTDCYQSEPHLPQPLEPPDEPERCPSCGNQIQSDVCWCGCTYANHDHIYDHSFVPMGCDCGRDKSCDEKLEKPDD